MFVKFGLQDFLKRPAVGFSLMALLTASLVLCKFFVCLDGLFWREGQEAVKILGKIHAISFWRRRL